MCSATWLCCSSVLPLRGEQQATDNYPAITGLGIAEFDDVFGNTMGGWIGVLVAWTWLNRKMSLKNRA